MTELLLMTNTPIWKGHGVSFCNRNNRSRPTNLTLILLTWRIWWVPNNASKWQMGFNLAFKGL